MSILNPFFLKSETFLYITKIEYICGLKPQNIGVNHVYFKHKNW